MEWKSGISQILHGMAEMRNNSAKSGIVGMSAFILSPVIFHTIPIHNAG